MTKNAKKTAATTAVALLAATSVTTGSLFETPAALLPDDGAPSIVYNMNNALDGAEDDAAGVTRTKARRPADAAASALCCERASYSCRWSCGCW